VVVREIVRLVVVVVVVVVVVGVKYAIGKRGGGEGCLFRCTVALLALSNS
jgi:hypothetical protein